MWVARTKSVPCGGTTFRTPRVSQTSSSLDDAVVRNGNKASAALLQILNYNLPLRLRAHLPQMRSSAEGLQLLQIIII